MGAPMWEYLSALVELPLDDGQQLTEGAQERRCRCGNDFPAAVPDGEYRVYGESGEFLMVGRAQKGRMATVKSFFEVV